MPKAIIFDASTLISFAMNGLFDEIVKLKENFDGKFIITKEVKGEIIDRPLTIKRFELEALRLKGLFDDNILEPPLSLGVKDSEVTSRSAELLDIANATFEANGRKMHIVDMGEVSCLALSQILNKQGVKNVIAVDERTARMLVEKPENLEKLFEKKLHTKVRSNLNNFNFFKEFKIIRSTELVYLAYKKGLVHLKNGQVLDALLYALKFKGCSISDEEIREIEKLN